ncbi:orotate phosphoribosyltransferase [Bacteroidota bacterium]
MTREELAKAIYESSHITGEFKLRSGMTSNEYFDKYLFESQPELLLEICNHIIDILPDNFDVLAGLEMGGIPIATMLSQLIGKPVCFVRKNAKEYGTCKLAEGTDIKDQKLLIVEDVITSGGQVVISTDELRRRGAIITNAICVIDRESGGSQNLAEKGIEIKPLFTMSEIKSLL